jgi:hypothetical protein
MKKIPLTQGQFALVDDWNYDWLNQFKWCAKKDYKNGTFYAIRNSSRKENNGKQKQIFMHRVIMKTPEGMDCDHKNHNGCNDQEYNLRNCTHQQNQQNRKKEKDCSSEHKGVTWDKKRQKWKAQIKFNGKSIHLGMFTSEIEAAMAYNKAAKELFKEFVCLNSEEGEIPKRLKPVLKKAITPILKKTVDKPVLLKKKLIQTI